MSSNEHDDLPMAYTCRRDGLEQRLLCADLEMPGAVDKTTEVLPGRVGLVYSDPPWNPGNATYWRTYAGADRCRSYDLFLDAWVAVVVECIRRGARHVFCEQSANEKHWRMLLEATRRNTGWSLPLLESWTVFYGNVSARRPNMLLHFGGRVLRTDPSGMAGEPMTTRVCSGVNVAPGEWIVDPCMGKGMTSRMAHYFQWNAVGVELNQKRLAHTAKWLRRQGYEEDAR